jgi:hypothetical protein
MEDREDAREERQESKKNLKEEYAVLQEKYDLPNFEDLDRDFEISDIDTDKNILREIIKEMHSQIEFYSRILESIIQPDSKFADMKEAENFTADDHKIIYEIYRNFMFINRTLILTNLEYSQESASREISNAYSNFQDIKKNLLFILTKMKDTWKIEKQKEPHGGYYG